MKCQIKQIDVHSISCIKPLWKKLNIVHMADSHYFKEYYRTMTFEKRIGKFVTFSADAVFIEGVFSSSSTTPVGYCISTVEKEKGEIDSLFIEEPYRKCGYGAQLVGNSIQWLKERGCTTIRVAVAEGHESVFGFYKQFGFYPRLTYLQLKEE
jgi:diamine N-acetyltransferase